MDESLVRLAPAHLLAVQSDLVIVIDEAGILWR